MCKCTEAFVSSSVWVLQCRDGGEVADALSSWHLVTSVPHDSITSSQICWVPPWQKKLCAQCLHRDKHTTQNTRAFLNGKKNWKRRRVMESTWGQFCCALKALLCCQGSIFLHSAMMNIPLQERWTSVAGWSHGSRKENKRAWRCKTENFSWESCPVWNVLYVGIFQSIVAFNKIIFGQYHCIWHHF